METWGNIDELNVVSHGIPRVEGADKVTGKAKFTYDVNLPGMLYGAILRCPYACARVVKIDAGDAEELKSLFGAIAQTKGDIYI